jgi:hypothetical protein
MFTIMESSSEARARVCPRPGHRLGPGHPTTIISIVAAIRGHVVVFSVEKKCKKKMLREECEAQFASELHQEIPQGFNFWNSHWFGITSLAACSKIDTAV